MTDSRSLSRGGARGVTFSSTQSWSTELRPLVPCAVGGANGKALPSGHPRILSNLEASFNLYADG